ncbi:MAG: DUF4392 domain-containing protein [Candidatus Rokubacteria bacterium]|nr:DUF4392 domain-containing protein [Candidatus Rokubacteria bacterium]
MRDAIDSLLALDPGGRGIEAFFRPGGALGAARALLHARRVLIVTGFTVAPGAPETDGPPGAAVLGRALRRRGARVRYVSDPHAIPVLRSALRALGEPTSGVIGASTTDGLLAGERPTHLVAIERPGRARSGDYLNARGRSVREWNAPLDEIFCRGVGEAGSGRGWPEKGAARRGVGEAGSGRGWPEQGAAPLRGRATGRVKRPGRFPVTIAVGDGGNEIGMGNVRARLVRQGGMLAQIASVVRVDHLVVAGTSNWGAYGIVAALERLAGRPLLHTPALERRMVVACVAAGAVDGLTLRREPTVDGLPLDVHAGIVGLLGAAAGGPTLGRMGRTRRRGKGRVR